MKVWKKCEVLFLTVLLCITDDGSTCPLAASDSQDGLEVTLTTGQRRNICKGEEIVAR